MKDSEQKFNPYKLKIIHDANDLTKVSEYYTVSPSGIVHIFSNGNVNKMENFASKTPTEFISLSDWMRESTMFNILSNIDFFKNYLATKIFKSWRENIKKLLFIKTREKIRNNVFFCKPSYVNSIFEIKSSLANVLNFEMVNFTQCQQKQVDFEEFKSMQKDVRTKVSKEYDGIFEEVIGLLGKLVTNIEATKVANSNVEEESCIIIKQKPLNLIKKEKEERKMRKRLSEDDYKRLGSYLRLINYMAIEILIFKYQRKCLKHQAFSAPFFI